MAQPIDIQPVVEELTQVLNTGRGSHGDVLTWLKATLLSLRQSAPTQSQADSLRLVEVVFRTLLTERRVIHKAEIAQQRQDALRAIHGLRDAYPCERNRP